MKSMMPDKKEMGNESMSSLAGKSKQTSYMAGGSQAPDRMGQEQGFPGHEKVEVIHHVGEHTDHSSKYASAHHFARSTMNGKKY